MEKIIRIWALGVFVMATLIAQACSLNSVHVSSLKTFGLDGVTETASFKTGDYLKAKAQLGGSPDKTYVDFELRAEDVPGMTKGDGVPQTGVTESVNRDKNADYLKIISPNIKSGTYTLRAELKDKNGAIIPGGKSVTITITQAAP